MFRAAIENHNSGFLQRLTDYLAPKMLPRIGGFHTIIATRFPKGLRGRERQKTIVKGAK